MRPGIIGTVQLAATLAFALPVALFGVEFLLSGNLLGLAFVGLAVGMVAAEEYLTTPKDLPALAAEKTVGAVVREPDDED